MSAPKYHINTVMDFLAVPPERRGVCLQEFGVWLHLAETYSEVLKGLPVEWDSEFVWIDDDKAQVSVNLNGNEISNFSMRGADE